MAGGGRGSEPRRRDRRDAGPGRAGGGVMDAEAERWGVDPPLSREDLEAAVEGSARELPAADHRRLHRDAGDFVRWGRRGGLRTLALYGRPYFALLARLRWGRVEVEALVSYREALR